MTTNDDPQLAATWKEISSDFPFVRRYLFGVMCADAAMSAFPAVSAVFLVTQLGASGSRVATVMLCLLVTGAFTSPIADKVSKACGRKLIGTLDSGLLSPAA